MSLISLLTAMTTFSQINERSNFYIQNPFMHNPAYTGDQGKTVIFLKSRQMLVGMPGAPRNYSIGAHSLIAPHSGLGAILSTQTHGIFNEMTGSLNYSHILYFGKDMSLSLGVSAGFLNKSLSGLSEKEEADELINNDNYQHALFTTGLGSHFVWKNLYIDFSSPTLYRNGDDHIGVDLFTAIGYNYKTYNNKILLQPIAGYRQYGNNDGFVEFGVTATYDDSYWVTLNGNHFADLNLGAGLNYKQFGIGYTFEYVNSPIKLGSNGTHEVMFLYRFGKKKRSAKVYNSKSGV